MLMSGTPTPSLRSGIPGKPSHSSARLHLKIRLCMLVPECHLRIGVALGAEVKALALGAMLPSLSSDLRRCQTSPGPRRNAHLPLRDSRRSSKLNRVSGRSTEEGSGERAEMSQRPRRRRTSARETVVEMNQDLSGWTRLLLASEAPKPSEKLLESPSQRRYWMTVAIQVECHPRLEHHCRRRATKQSAPKNRMSRSCGTHV